MKKLISNKGITLVALIITIIVLLILAMVAIKAVTGDGIIEKATKAQKDYSAAKIVEDVQLDLNEWKIFKATEGKELGAYLSESGKYTNVTGDNNRGYTVEKDGYIIQISVEGKVTDANKAGQVTTIYQADRTGIAVGDYIDYTPDEASAYLATNLASTITGTSSNRANIFQDNNIKWQVLKIDDDGTMDLIGTPTSSKISFSGALGYNNGVYVMNDICKSLYSKSSEGITARSVNLDDFKYWIEKSVGGIGARDAYNNGVKTYGETKIYMGNYSCRPDIFEKTDNESDSCYSTPTTNTYSGGESSDTLEAKQTYYKFDSIDENSYGEGSKVLNIGPVVYWLASRYVNCDLDNALFGLRFGGSSFDGAGMLYSDRRTVIIS